MNEMTGHPAESVAEFRMLAQSGEVEVIIVSAELNPTIIEEPAANTTAGTEHAPTNASPDMPSLTAEASADFLTWLDSDHDSLDLAA